MGREEGHRRGEESDALAAISRALQAAAAAAPAAATPPAPQPQHKEAKKDKKDKREASDKKKKRKHDAAAAAVAEPAEPDGPGAGMQQPEPATAESGMERVLQRLRQAAAALQQAAEQMSSSPPSRLALQQQLEALAVCAEQLGSALAAAGAAQPPAALQLLQSQARLLLDSCQPSGGSMPALPPLASQLAALQLQAMAAAAAVEQRQAQPVALPADDPGERLRFQQHFMAAFADCYAAEVEALQEAEPPIPAGVLLQCVRMAADSEALHPPRLRAVMLDAAVAAGQP